MSGYTQPIANLAFTDTRLPILRADPIEANGSLMILDARDFAPGVPANNTYVPNRVADRAAEVTGVSAAGNAHNAYAYSTLGATGSIQGVDMIAERSGHGGLHISLKSTMTANGQGARLDIRSAIYDYMRAHPNHHYFASQWGYRTKAATAPGAATAQMNGFSDGYAYAFGTVPIQNGNVVVAQTNAERNTVGAQRAAETVTTLPTRFNTVAYAGDRSNALNMSNGGYNLTTHRGVQGGFIFYRFVLEDLTVSGRSHAEADAIDAALFAEAFASGGDFDPATETFTAPL